MKHPKNFLKQALAELDQELERITERSISIHRIKRVLVNLEEIYPFAKSIIKRKVRRLSRAARARIAKAQKARWQTWRAKHAKKGRAKKVKG